MFPCTPRQPHRPPFTFLVAHTAARNRLDKFRGSETVADSLGERVFALLPSRPAATKRAIVVISQNHPLLIIKSLVDGYAESGIIRIIISAPLDRAIAVYFVDGATRLPVELSRARARRTI
jgi:hypothetical protein